MAGRAVRRAAVAAALAALLTACGSGSGGAPAASPSASADPTVLATPTDRSPHGVLLSAQLAVHGARRARFSGNLGSDTVAGLLFWAPKTVLQLKRPGTTEEVVVLDTTAYRGGDAATAGRLGGRHWEKFTGVPGADGQRAVPYAGTVDRLNPVVALTAAVAAPAPGRIGEEEIDGTAVVHYRVATTVADYAEAQTQLPTARRAALRTALGDGGVITLDVWLNDRDQPVQLQRTGSGAAERVSDTLRFDEFGGPLSVQAPAESDTADAGDRSLPPL
ncbi:hypothetical protein [Streptomyces sp. NRRL B-24484]|uniref:hypothetical protein n=1 Tax=Streptomyces sp. NRRL B-24484 TaxID=1463833 RepID=UPI0004C2845A|nr:hypothetical protein [Streptomyces sp. NRRL B-24484]